MKNKLNACNLKTLVVLGMLTLTFGTSARKVQAITYDPVTGWSSTTNTLASGVWTYGQAPLASPTSFSLLPNYVNPYYPGLDTWRVSAGVGNPGIYHNTTAATPFFPSNEIMLHPGPLGEFAILRFTAPSTGIYSIVGQFIARDNTTITTTDVAVLNNGGGSLFTGNVMGTVGTGAQPFNLLQSLTAGQNVDFRVGYGSNNNNAFDSTGLSLSISTSAPEPATLSLLALGGIGVLGTRLRRRER